MTRKFIVFINPISGTDTKDELDELLKDALHTAGFDYEIQPTNAHGDYQWLSQNIVAENFTDVIICGGDGTISQIISHLLDVDVLVGIVPMGSGNGLALAAGIPQDIKKALQLIVQGNSIKVDGLFINGRFSCMMCGVGFDAQVAADFAADSERGLKTYIKQSYRNFHKAPAFPFTITLGKITITTDAFCINIAIGNQYGNHITIAPKARLSDGLIDVVIIKKMSKAKLIISLLAHLVFGKPKPARARFYRAQNILYYQVTNLTISNPALAPLHIDGEPAETASQFDIKILPAAYRLMV